MLKNLRTGDTSFLGYMAYQDNRDSCLLGKSQEHCSRFLYLRHGTGRRLDILREHGLDRVHDHQIRHYGFRFRDYIFHQCLAVYQAVGILPSYSRRSQLHLLRTFLACHIESFKRRAMQRNLQRQSGFSYTRLSAYQHQRALDEAASENTVDLSVVQ